MFEGTVAQATCIITPEVLRHEGQALWLHATNIIVNRFQDKQNCPLAKGVRDVLNERLAELYDFQKGTAREVTLGAWFRSISMILRMIRSSAAAIVTPSTA